MDHQFQISDRQCQVQMASLTLARLKSLTFSAGTTMGVPAEPLSPAATRAGVPIISTFASRSANDWLNRKFVTGLAILPFSIRNVPSRVRPVTEMMRGLSGRMYQKRVINTPRRVVRIMSSSDAVPPVMIRFDGVGRGAAPWRSAQNRE